MGKPDLDQNVGKSGISNAEDFFSRQAMVQTLKDLWNEGQGGRMLLGMAALGAGKAFGYEGEDGEASRAIFEAAEQLVESEDEADKKLGMTIAFWLHEGRDKLV